MKLLAITLLLCLFPATGPAASSEIWAYLMKGEEKCFPPASPITDIACFSAQVDGDGRLQDGHLQPPALPGALPGARYHLVATIPWNATLAHIYLDKTLPFRNRIVADLVERSKPFDGVQIDFESIAAADRAAYLDFLAAVHTALPRNKLLSTAVVARWPEYRLKHPDDAFDYAAIAAIVDRVVVMAYDEHYGGGRPGPIASLPWCRKILDYALATVPPGKLVMGIPLYGRAWQTPDVARAYKYSEVLAEMREKGIRPDQNPEDGGSYRFTQTVVATVYYENYPSLAAKLDLYDGKPLRGTAFWRISQEPEGFWQWLWKRKAGGTP